MTRSKKLSKQEREIAAEQNDDNGHHKSKIYVAEIVRVININTSY